jgi:hypothetical protein
MLKSRSNAGPSRRTASSIPSRAHGVPACRPRRLVAGAEGRQHAVPDVLVDKAVVVEHRLGGRDEVAVQHVHDVIGQALLAEGREVPNIREEDREIEFFSLAGGSSRYFVEVEHNDVLCLVEETANDHIALDASLTREAREFIPAPSGCYLLFDLAPRRDIGKPVPDLNTAGRAPAVATALMEVWDPMADRDVKEFLTFGDVFERNFVEVSDSWHDRFPEFPRSPPISTSLCLDSAFRAILNRCRRFSTAVRECQSHAEQRNTSRLPSSRRIRCSRKGRRIMELKAIASINILAIMFSGLDQRKEALAAARVSCMRPELDFGATIMLPWITIGYPNSMAT